MPDLGEGTVDAERAHRAQLLQRGLHREPGVDEHMVNVHPEDLLHALFAVRSGKCFLIGKRVRILRPQPHVAGQDAMAIRVVERLEVVPLVDGHRRERGEHVIGERRVAGLLLDVLLDLVRRAAGRLVDH